MLNPGPCIRNPQRCTLQRCTCTLNPGPWPPSLTRAQGSVLLVGSELRVGELMLLPLLLPHFRGLVGPGGAGGQAE